MREEASLQLATVERGDIVRTADVAGVVVSAPPAEAAAPVGGTIDAAACAVGDRIDAGRVCARIIPPDLQAEVARARRAFDAAQAAQRKRADAFERAKAAYESATSKRKARTRAAAARAESRLAQAQAETSRREAALRAALEKGAAVVAPVGGAIRDSRLEAGGKAKAGDILFRVDPADRDALHIEAAPEAGAALQARPGATVTATLAADAAQRIEGRLREIVPTQRGPRIVVDAPAPASAAQPGGAASLRIELDRRENVLRVPSRALTYVPAASAPAASPPAGWARVWAWREGAAVPVDVKPGLDDGAFAEISDGALEAGDRVIVDGER
nr:HlyD family efflux transporter periplasmic adaptor subunit [Methylocystis sp. ATCC 49242]